MITLHDYMDDLETWSLDDYLIERIPKHTAKEFIAEYHYAGGAGNAIMPWGLYETVNLQLVGVIAFQTPISENTRASIFEDISEPAHVQAESCVDCPYIDEEHGYREHVTELHRMALHPDCPKNTATWFISRALGRLKEYKPKYWAVISMADSTEGHDGTVYQAANADYYGTSRARAMYEDGDGRLHSTRQLGKNIKIEEAKARGWDVNKRDVKHRYVFWLPDEHLTKDELRELSEIELREYPS